MTTADKFLIMQAASFAREFIKEADRASGGLSSETHRAAAQLRASLEALPSSIEGCKCEEFQSAEVFTPENPIPCPDCGEECTRFLDHCLAGWLCPECYKRIQKPL